MRTNYSLNAKLIGGALACVLLAFAMWVVLFLSNRTAESRLEASERDLARVSSLRSLIALTEKVTSPVLNAADYGSDLEEREREFKAASAGVRTVTAALDEHFTSEEAQSSGYKDARDRLFATMKDAGRIMEILSDGTMDGILAKYEKAPGELLRVGRPFEEPRR